MAYNIVYNQIHPKVTRINLFCLFELPEFLLLIEINYCWYYSIFLIRSEGTILVFFLRQVYHRKTSNLM